MDNLTLHLQAFNDRVKAMNQMKQTDLRLTAVEANNILSDLFAVLAQVSRLQRAIENNSNEVVQVVVDGGGF